MSAPPDFDKITGNDLSDDDRLRLLYVEAVRRKFWPNTARDVLEFWCLAEKALSDDKHGTPGKLFYSLVRAKVSRFVTDTHEQRAMARIHSADRQALVDQAEGADGSPAPSPDEVEDALVGRDVGFYHAIMMQCFLPQKALPNGRREWQVRHGRASMLVESGRVVIPEKTHEFRHCDVPAGTKPRLILPYIMGYAVSRKTREIDMGKSLRRFMNNIGMPVTGRNGKILAREVENVAAANFYLGTWSEEGGTTRFARVAKELSFWVERNNEQLSIWRPEMVLSAEFYDAIQHHRVPVDMSHLLQLSKSPRRMDLYCWLSYRLPRISSNNPTPIALRHLQPIFAPDIVDPYLFKQRLKDDLKAIFKVYDGFNVQLRKDALWLVNSFPPVPEKLVYLL